MAEGPGSTEGECDGLALWRLVRFRVVLVPSGHTHCRPQISGHNYDPGSLCYLAAAASATCAVWFLLVALHNMLIYLLSADRCMATHLDLLGTAGQAPSLTTRVFRPLSLTLLGLINSCHRHSMLCVVRLDVVRLGETSAAA